MSADTEVKHASWGLYPHSPQMMRRLASRHADLPLNEGETLLPYGLGRSYGDSCLNSGGVILSTAALDHFIAFDDVTGHLTAEAGVTFAAIIELLTPRGWFLPVTPGTKHVTLAGAIANDVHGKNHHRAGTFGAHVLSFELLTSDGQRRLCSRDENADVFEATIGGLGLTGLITKATIKMMPVASAFLIGQSIRFDNLDEFFTIADASVDSHDYTVSWIDCLAGGRALGRGHFLRANVATADEAVARKAPLALPLVVPVTPPVSLVNRLTLKPLNAAYYHRQQKEVVKKLWHYNGFHYPLDAIAHWNRIYGPKGFLQYQCVVPRSVQHGVSRALLREIEQSGQGSFLAVFKTFGRMKSPGLLSFPMEGATLALDFPVAGPETFALLNRLDAIVIEAGGRIYPAKDARMSPETFEAAYPRFAEFSKFIDPRIRSDFLTRVSGNK